MSEWKKVKLGDCCLIGDGAHASLKRQGKGILYITAKNLTSNGLDYSKVDYISEELYNKHFSERNGAITRPIKNDIIFSIIGSLGGSYLVKDEKLGISSSVAIFRSKGDILQLYLFYYLKSEKIKSEIDSIKGGVAQGFMSLSKLGSLTIYFPTSLKLQQRITTILSRYDSLIENYQKQIKLLEESAQRIYKEWFIDLHFPGHENTKIVDGVPEGWEKKKINDVCDTIGGGTPSTKVQEYYEGGNISWVTPTDITRNNSLCLLSTEKKITQEGLDHSSAKMLPEETILMTSRASVGYFGICDFEVCTNQGFISCVPFKKNFQMYLLYNLINRVEEIRIKAGGSTYLEISKSVFRNFNIISPSDDVLKSFQYKAHKPLDEIRYLSKQIRHLTEARDRLLPKLMSGEIEV